MKTIMITSPTITGEIELRFENGWLTFYECRAAMTEKQIRWMLKNLPLAEGDVEDLIRIGNTLKATEIKREITFEMFWQKYDHKAVSNKKKSESLWNRMPKAERTKAYFYIDKYFSSIPGGVAKKYAETYLRSQIWEQ